MVGQGAEPLVGPAPNCFSLQPIFFFAKRHHFYQELWFFLQTNFNRKLLTFGYVNITDLIYYKDLHNNFLCIFFLSCFKNKVQLSIYQIEDFILNDAYKVETLQYEIDLNTIQKIYQDCSSYFWV